MLSTERRFTLLSDILYLQHNTCFTAFLLSFFRTSKNTSISVHTWVQLLYLSSIHSFSSLSYLYKYHELVLFQGRNIFLTCFIRAHYQSELMGKRTYFRQAVSYYAICTYGQTRLVAIFQEEGKEMEENEQSEIFIWFNSIKQHV